MKQVLQNSSGDTVVRDVPPPPCPPGGVLVRNEFSVISSGTERARVEQKSALGRVMERPELALKAVDRVRREGLRETRQMVHQMLSEESPSGYSCAGTVVEVGAAVRGLSVGDRVACAGAGHANHAEIISVPRNLCARVPDGVPMEAAALTTIASIALHGIRLAEVRLGDRVAVIGCGLLGQIACRLLRAAGAHVIAIDIDPERVEQASAGGAHDGFAVADDTGDAVRATTGGIGVDEVLVTAAAASSDPVVLAADVARERATVVLVGDVLIDVPRDPLYMKELTFRVSRSYGPGRYDADYEERGLDYPIGYVRWTEQRNMECVLDLQSRGALALRDLIDDVVPIERAQDAYARIAGPASGRPRGALAFGYGEHENGGAAPVESPPTAALSPLESGRAVRIGLIGPGAFAGSVLVPALSRAGAQLAAVAGGSGPSAESLGRKAAFERVLQSERELIADPSLDAVVVATRHGTHAELSSACLDAGKHVFCEKPLALDAAELDAVLGSAASAGRVLTVGFNRRFAPHVVTMRELAERAGGPATIVYRVNAGRVPPAAWPHDLEQGGGRIVGEVCHFLDTIVFLAGAPIVEVHASGFGAPEQPVQARDNVVITVRLRDGSVATVAYVADGSPSLAKERIELFAGGRTAILDDFTSLELHDGPKPRRQRLRQQDKGHDAEIEAFLAGVRDGRHPIALDQLANVHRACYAAVESLRTGRPAGVRDGG